MEHLTGDFYDASYYTTGEKSGYKPYTAGNWARDLAAMVFEYLSPKSVLDVGGAYGYVVQELYQFGVPARGFDISPFAISRRVTEAMSLGSVDDPGSWSAADLALASELAEHLQPPQAEKMFRLALEHVDRMLLLICINQIETDDGVESAVDTGDHSHINIRPMWWWKQLAEKVGWAVGDATRFNEDQRSTAMSWQGRFLLLEKR